MQPNLLAFTAISHSYGDFASFTKIFSFSHDSFEVRSGGPAPAGRFKKQEFGVGYIYSFAFLCFIQNPHKIPKCTIAIIVKRVAVLHTDLLFV